MSISNYRTNLYDKKVRAALCEVLSEEDMQKIIWEDRGFFSSGWFLPLHPSLQIKSISKTNSVMAEELLLEAGWKNDDGILKKNQEPFTITLLYLLSDDKREEVVEYIKECWESLGIIVQIEPVMKTLFSLLYKSLLPTKLRLFCIPGFLPLIAICFLFYIQQLFQE